MSNLSRFAHKRETDTTLTSRPQNTRAYTKPRTIFTEAQVASLEKSYLQNSYPSAMDRARLACSLQLDSETIDNWYAERSRVDTEMSTDHACFP